jgi:hypothetical protein
MTNAVETKRWADEVGLDVSRKPDSWEISVRIETTGKLPPILGTGATSFWLKVTPGGWWMVLEYSVPRLRRMKTCSYISWSPRDERWHEQVKQPFRLFKRERLEPPTRLATLRAWLTYAETQAGIRFRRDRPLIQSNIKGGAKAMAAWIRETPSQRIRS